MNIARQFHIMPVGHKLQSSSGRKNGDAVTPFYWVQLWSNFKFASSSMIELRGNFDFERKPQTLVDQEIKLLGHL